MHTVLHLLRNVDPLESDNYTGVWIAFKMFISKITLFYNEITYLRIVTIYFRMTNMSQEVGKVHPAEGKMDYSKYPLGSMLFIYPFHVSWIPSRLHAVCIPISCKFVFVSIRSTLKSHSYQPQYKACQVMNHWFDFTVLRVADWNALPWAMKRVNLREIH